MGCVGSDERHKKHEMSIDKKDKGDIKRMPAKDDKKDEA